MASGLMNLMYPLSKMLRKAYMSPGLPKALQSGYSTISDDPSEEESIEDVKDNEHIDIQKREPQPQGVDPKRGWGFRGVHRAILCGKVGQTPVQKILRNGGTVTIFTVGTGGMFDQRYMGTELTARPIQWHRIAVHSVPLGAYAVQRLTKNASVYVEGDIETRVYNDNINGTVKSVPEICVRQDGRVHLINASESASQISLDGLSMKTN